MQLLKFRALDLTIISALHSCILLLFFPKNHWTVFVVIVVISAAARKETVVQVRQEVAGRCMTAGRGVKEFHFPHMRRKTEARQLDFLVIRPQQNSIIIALYIENATLSEILYICDAVF